MAVTDRESRDGAPVVFVFHGHGGNMVAAAQVPHRGALARGNCRLSPRPADAEPRDPDGKRAGWQREQGAESDRDLKFFDGALATLKEKHAVDLARIYVTGHSNGGGFTYLLLAASENLCRGGALRGRHA